MVYFLLQLGMPSRSYMRYPAQQGFYDTAGWNQNWLQSAVPYFALLYVKVRRAKLDQKQKHYSIFKIKCQYLNQLAAKSPIFRN